MDREPVKIKCQYCMDTGVWPDNNTKHKIPCPFCSLEMIEEGLKNDDDKIRFDLNPTEIELALAEALTFGASRYGEHNWKKGIKYSRIVAALKRHLFAFLNGERCDDESGLHPLAHVAANLAFLITFETHQEIYKEFNDLPKYGKRE